MKCPALSKGGESSLKSGVLIDKGGVLISGVVLYTSLSVCIAVTMHIVLIKGGALISGVVFAHFCTCV